jgi:peroxiredoxin Q/BCP
MNELLRCAAGLCAVLALAAGAARAQKDPVGLPEVGKPAPAFDLPATQVGSVLPAKKDAATLSLKDLKGKNVVLFFFPKAMTKGCTIESCGFRDMIPKFAAADAVVVGISNDSLALQEKFTKKEKLSFPLLADADKSVTKAYGALSAKDRPSRYTFVIDKAGVLRKIYTKVNPQKHPEEVLSYVKKDLSSK